MIAGSASFTNCPRTNAGARSVNRAVVVDRLEDRPPLRAADVEVVRAERRRDVDDAGAVVHRDEVGRDHGVGVLDVRDTAARSARRPGRAARRSSRRSLVAQGRGRERLARRSAARRPARPRRSRPAVDRRPALDGSVHGVVVHTTSDAPTSAGRPPRRPGTARRRSGPRRSRSPGPPRRPTAPCRTAGSTRSTL